MKLSFSSHNYRLPVTGVLLAALLLFLSVYCQADVLVGNGMLEKVNASGKAQPFFPIGFYVNKSILTDGKPADISDLGMNSILPAYSFRPSDNPEEYLKFLDQCRDNNIAVISSVLPTNDTESPPETFSKIKENVELVYRHPSVIGWYSFDEPRFDYKNTGARALSFESSDSRAVFLDIGIRLKNKFTIELWVAPVYQNKPFTLFSVKGLRINYLADGRVEAELNTEGGRRLKTARKMIGSVDHGTGNWQHLAVTNSGNGRLTIWRDGREEAVLNGCPDIQTWSGNSNLILGGGNFRGRIDDLRILNKTADIRKFWDDHSYLIPFQPDSSTMGLWKFNENKGTSSRDLAGRQEGAILNNIKWTNGLIYDISRKSFTPAHLAAAKRSIREADPIKHPVIPVFYLKDGVLPYLYRDSYDVLMVDHYPAHMDAPPLSRVFPDMTARIMELDNNLNSGTPFAPEPRPFFMVLQAYGGPYSQSEIYDYDQHEFFDYWGNRAPLLPEYRYQLWSSIAYGARGLFFWTEYRMNGTPDGRNLVKKNLKFLTGELAAYVPALLSSEKHDMTVSVSPNPDLSPQPYIPLRDESGFHESYLHLKQFNSLVFKHGDEIYLAVINNAALESRNYLDNDMFKKITASWEASGSYWRNMFTYAADPSGLKPFPVLISDDKSTTENPHLVQRITDRNKLSEITGREVYFSLGAYSPDYLTVQAKIDAIVDIGSEVRYVSQHDIFQLNRQWRTWKTRPFFVPPGTRELTISLDCLDVLSPARGKIYWTEAALTINNPGNFLRQRNFMESTSPEQGNPWRISPQTDKARIIPYTYKTIRKDRNGSVLQDFSADFAPVIEQFLPLTGGAARLKGRDVTFEVYLNLPPGTVYDSTADKWRSLEYTAYEMKARTGAVSVFDEARQKLWVWGGYHAGTRPVSWMIYNADLNEWSEVNGKGEQKPWRRDACAAFDSGRKHIWVFGGRSDNSVTGNYGVFDTGSLKWTGFRARNGLPGPLHNSACVYDPIRDRIIIQGGYNEANEITNAVYAFDLKTRRWTRPATFGSVSPFRAGHTITYDEGGDRLILIGGVDHSGFPTDEVFTLDLERMRWTRRRPGGSGPGALAYHTAAYDPDGRRMVVFGGLDRRKNKTGDLHILDCNNLFWSAPVTTGFPPGPLSGHIAAWSGRHNRMFVFSGDPKHEPVENAFLEIDDGVGKPQRIKIEDWIPGFWKRAAAKGHISERARKVTVRIRPGTDPAFTGEVRLKLAGLTLTDWRDPRIEEEVRLDIGNLPENISAFREMTPAYDYTAGEGSGYSYKPTDEARLHPVSRGGSGSASIKTRLMPLEVKVFKAVTAGDY